MTISSPTYTVIHGFARPAALYRGCRSRRRNRIPRSFREIRILEDVMHGFAVRQRHDLGYSFAAAGCNPSSAPVRRLGARGASGCASVLAVSARSIQRRSSLGHDGQARNTECPPERRKQQALGTGHRPKQNLIPLPACAPAPGASAGPACARRRFHRGGGGGSGWGAARK